MAFSDEDIQSAFALDQFKSHVSQIAYAADAFGPRSISVVTHYRARVLKGRAAVSARTLRAVPSLAVLFRNGCSIRSAASKCGLDVTTIYRLHRRGIIDIGQGRKAVGRFKSHHSPKHVYSGKPYIWEAKCSCGADGGVVHGRNVAVRWHYEHLRSFKRARRIGVSTKDKYLRIKGHALIQPVRHAGTPSKGNRRTYLPVCSCGHSSSGLSIYEIASWHRAHKQSIVANRVPQERGQ